MLELLRRAAPRPYPRYAQSVVIHTRAHGMRGTPSRRRLLRNGTSTALTGRRPPTHKSTFFLDWRGNSPVTPFIVHAHFPQVLYPPAFFFIPRMSGKYFLFTSESLDGRESCYAIHCTHVLSSVALPPCPSPSNYRFPLSNGREISLLPPGVKTN